MDRKISIFAYGIRAADHRLTTYTLKAMKIITSGKIKMDINRSNAEISNLNFLSFEPLLFISSGMKNMLIVPENVAIGPDIRCRLAKAPVATACQ